LRHHRATKSLFQRFPEPGQLSTGRFRIEDALIPDPTVVLYPEADDLDGQLIGFGMKLPRQIARRAAARFLAIGEDHDEAGLVAVVEHVGRLDTASVSGVLPAGLKASIAAMMREAAFGVGFKSRRMVHWFQPPEP
jgi:hypothetical protein